MNIDDDHCYTTSSDVYPVTTGIILSAKTSWESHNSTVSLTKLATPGKSTRVIQISSRRVSSQPTAQPRSFVRNEYGTHESDVPAIVFLPILYTISHL